MRQLDKIGKLPLSLQAQQYLLSLIEDGTYQPGERFPSETDLAAQLGISRATLREALLNLEQLGAVVRKHGIGTFVAAGYGHQIESGLEQLVSVVELAARQGLQATFGDLQVREEPADPEVADKLQVAPGISLTTIRRVILVDEKPAAYMFDAVLPSVLSPADIDETFNGSVLDLLTDAKPPRQKCGLRITWALAELVACNADAFIARELGIKRGQAVLLTKQVSFDEEGRAVEFSRGYFVPEFFRFYIARR